VRKTVLPLASMALGLLISSAVALVVSPYAPALAQSTVADTKHPRVIEVRPAEGATGVSPTSGEFSEGHKVVAFFSEDMKPGSAMWAIKLYKKGSDTWEDSTMGYNAAQRKVTLWPPNPLERGVTYKAVVSTRAKDLAGNRLDQSRNRDGLQPKVWYFTIEQ
jgi:Bacterial Ig-like domain